MQKSLQPNAAVILMTAFGSIHTAVEAMKIGAVDFVQKPFEIEEMELKIEKAIEIRHLKYQVDYLRTAQVAPAADRFGRLAAVAAFMQDRIANAFPFLLPRFISIFGPSMAALNLLNDEVFFEAAQALALPQVRSLSWNAARSPRPWSARPLKQGRLSTWDRGQSSRRLPRTKPRQWASR